jgi:hypothetical protein
MSCAISDLVSRLETIEVTGLVGGKGTVVDADGVLVGIGESLVQTAGDQRFRPKSPLKNP